MFKVNCYSSVMSYSTHLDLSDNELMNKCTCEYGVEVTPETYLAIQPFKLRVLPLGFKDGVEMVKVFYLTREYVPNRKGVNTNED